MNRRRFLQLSGAAAAAPVSSTAGAQAYPTRPVHLIVGFPAGGGTDAVARLMGQSLSQRLGPTDRHRQSAGREHQSRHRGGREEQHRTVYTLLLVGSPQAVNATLYDKPTVNVVSTSRRSQASPVGPTSWWSTRRFQPKPFPN